MSHYFPLSEEGIIRNLLENNNLLSLDGFALYKGISSSIQLSDYYIFDPNTSVRPSKTISETGNVYNLLLNNLPAWKMEYPLRENSIIASTNISTALDYAKKDKFGKVYIVIPETGAILAIAPNVDIWYSFKNSFEQIDSCTANLSLKRFNLHIRELAKAVGVEGFDTSWDNFVPAIKHISNIRPREFRGISKQALAIQLALYRNRINPVNFLNELLSPSLNNFILEKYSSKIEISRFPNNEAWTNSPCTFIEINRYKHFIEKQIDNG